MASTTTSNGSPEFSSFRNDIQKSFSQLSQLIKAAMGPVHAKYPYQPSNEPTASDAHILADLKAMGFKDVDTLVQTVHDESTGVQNDNSLLMERLIQLMAKLPQGSREGNYLSDSFINQLWSSLPHPPISTLDSKYRYRQPDGSHNNMLIPDLGKADMPYARSARPQTLQNIALPDPGDIFDMLMARGNKFKPHPNKISSMLFYLATIIIHDLFRTDHRDYNLSRTSSYLDLSPLYGSNWEEQQQIRTFKDGKLKPDCFSEKRLLGFPPGVGVLLIMFNRFHNHLVENLALINENGRFTKPKDDNKEALVKYDNDLFQTARLINCGIYVNVILKDYVRTILSLNRSGSLWDLDPRAVEKKTLLTTPAAEACGNSVSAEFNLIYRWHSAISERDDKWTQEEYKKLFPGKDPEDLSLTELVGRLSQMEAELDDDPLKRPFAGLSRLANGSFDDDGLVEILAASTEDVAGSFEANHVPQILRSVEILGIIQARSWNLGSLNELRQFFGLSKHETFEDINPDPEIAQKLRNLYDSPDFVELYPGLIAEKSKPPMTPGSGLCVNYTTSRAILSDAVALVRGDRFYTVDYTPKNLTNWGFTEASYDLTVDQGHVIYKLFYNAFPNHFKPNSIYAHFPFVIPIENKVILESLGSDDKYDWSRPARQPSLTVIKSHKAALQILGDKTNFKVTWGESIEFLVQQHDKKYGADFCLAGDADANAESRQLLMKALYPRNWLQEVELFYEDVTAKLLNQYTYKVGRANQVDVVRDISNLAHTHFSANLFSLPLKTEQNPRGIYTEQELCQVLSVCFFCIFYDVDPTKSFMLRNTAKMLAQQLGDLVLFNVEAVAKTGLIADVISRLHSKTELSAYGIHMIQRFLESGQSIKDVVWTQIMPTTASMVANQSQLFCQVLDYYLGDGAQYLNKLRILASQNTKEADEVLLRYFFEGARMRSTVGLFRSVAVDTVIDDGSTTIHLKKDEKLLINLVSAGMDPDAFPEPTEVKLDRDLDSYLFYGWGPHHCAGFDASRIAMVTMFKAILRLKNLRRATGPQGEIKKIPAQFGYTNYMTADWSSMFPIPTTMKIRWDD